MNSVTLSLSVSSTVIYCTLIYCTVHNDCAVLLTCRHNGRIRILGDSLQLTPARPFSCEWIWSAVPLLYLSGRIYLFSTFPLPFSTPVSTYTVDILDTAQRRKTPKHADVMKDLLDYQPSGPTYAVFVWVTTLLISCRWARRTQCAHHSH